jgi:LDH2 family malate/lactate/ureidoglycolate dehydrogenase
LHRHGRHHLRRTLGGAPGSGERRLGTDPWCFAAPGEPGRPFLLDMATTTTAYGKVRNRINEHLPAPLGWLLNEAGQATTDPLDVAERDGSLTSLGGSREAASYKGYGLAMMVDILAGGLSGMTYPSDANHTAAPGPLGIGHFVLALDPALFGDPAEFTTGVARFCDAMRTTAPVDPALPVLVAGDPERAKAARRRVEGIPVGAGLLGQVKAIAEAAGAPWLLG